MTKLFVGVFTLLFAIIISGVAAYFSVYGLAALFAAAALPVIIMGSALEGGKLIAAAWLHANWKNPQVNFFHKTYLMAAVVALMLITATGIYGYLSKGHLEQAAPVAGIELKIEHIQQQVDAKETDIRNLKARLEQLNAAVDVYFKNDYATKGLAVRAKQKEERAEISTSMDANYAAIASYNDQITNLKLQVNDVEAKLGPVKYVAQLFGWTDPEIAVRMLILLLMFAFDPLAVIMVLSGTITIGDYIRDRAERKAKNDEEDMIDANTRYAEAEKLLTEAHALREDNERMQEILANSEKDQSVMADTLKQQIADIEQKKADHDRMVEESITLHTELDKKYQQVTDAVYQIEMDRESLDQLIVELDHQQALIDNERMEINAYHDEINKKIAELHTMQDLLNEDRDQLIAIATDMLDKERILSDFDAEHNSILPELEKLLIENNTHVIDSFDDMAPDIDQNDIENAENKTRNAESWFCEPKY